MKRFLIFILDIVLLGAAMFVCYLFAESSFTAAIEQTMMLYFLLCLAAGATLFYLAAQLLHEWGHAVFGRRVGFVLLERTLFSRARTYRNGQLVRKVRRPFTLASVSMVPVGEHELKKRLMFYAVGGIVFSAAFLALCLAAVWLCSAFANMYIVAFVCPSLVCAFAVFKNAVIPDIRRGSYSDAYMWLALKTDSDFGAMTLLLAEISAGLWAGKTPSQLRADLYFKTPILSDTEAPVLHMNTYRFYYYLDRADTDNAFKTAMRLAESIGGITDPDMAVLPYFYVLLTLCLRKGSSDERAHAKGIAAICEKAVPEDSFAYLSLAYYYSVVTYDRAKRGTYLEKSKTCAVLLPDGVKTLAEKLVAETPDIPLK